MAVWMASSDDFNPLSPHGERPGCATSSRAPRYFNPLSPHGERRRDPLRRISGAISIHSPHTGRDYHLCRNLSIPLSISIHSPHTGRDLIVSPPELGGRKGFQSTLPTRGETVGVCYGAVIVVFQSTLPTRGETEQAAEETRRQQISIHSPHTGRDFCRPARAAIQSISIHSPHTGRDDVTHRRIYDRIVISIHSPHTGRDGHGFRGAGVEGVFQSTLPTRGETGELPPGQFYQINFNPLSPHGERPSANINTNPRTEFQSTLPTRGETESHAHTLQFS